MIDLILSGGSIVDGTGTAPYRTDLGVKGDRIALIGDCAARDSAARIDCSGLIIAPGFVDMHGHSDEILLCGGLAESKTRQGITTEVGGNCGMSPGPFSPDELVRRRIRLADLYGIETTWNDIGGFLDALDAHPPAINFCCLVGLGQTREAVTGASPDPLDKADLLRECALVKDACEQGAIGVSSGLIYPPGSFADRAELIALARAARDTGSPFYASHIRSEGDDLLAAVEEALEIGGRADVGVQLSHHKASGKRNWGKVHDSLALVEKARGSGMDVTIDQYPYKASSTGLDVILPSDVNVGGRDAVLRRLRDPQYAALTATRIDLEYGDRWNAVLISAVTNEQNKRFEGLTVAQIAELTGRKPVSAALDLLIEEELDVAAIYFTMCEDDVRAVLSYAQTCVGTDASARSAFGPTARGKPHPRAFGTFPRVLKRYVRDTRLLTLEEAVRRATSLPARRLGLRERGWIREGFFADLVVFDADRVADTSTYETPYRYPEGIDHVLVNGTLVVSCGKTTGSRPGRVLRRRRDL